jgi:hypothetical protein
MNHEQDLDRLIDEAARQMAQHDPSDALSITVMDRISAPATPFARPGLMWGSLAAAVVISAGVMFVEVNRTARSAEAPQQAQGSGLKAQGPVQAQGSGFRAQEQAQGSGLKAQGSAMPAATMAADETELLGDPITFESITPAPIEIERLDVATLTTIDPIEIAPIEIAPISTSDD